MGKLLEFIWGGIRGLGKLLRRVCLWVWTAAKSIITWIVAAVAYVVDTVATWISGAVSDALSTFGDSFDDINGVGAMPGVSALAAYYLVDILAMDVAFEYLVDLIAVWLLARTARWLMVPVRALLELL